MWKALNDENQCDNGRCTYNQCQGDRDEPDPPFGRDGVEYNQRTGRKEESCCPDRFRNAADSRSSWRTPNDPEYEDYQKIQGEQDKGKPAGPLHLPDRMSNAPAVEMVHATTSTPKKRNGPLYGNITINAYTSGIRKNITEAITSGYFITPGFCHVITKEFGSTADTIS